MSTVSIYPGVFGHDRVLRLSRICLGRESHSQGGSRQRESSILNNRKFSASISRRDLLKVAAIGALATSADAQFQPPALGAPTKSSPQRRRECSRIAGAKLDLSGWIRNYLDGVSEQWLKVVPFSNPAMLEMFRDRDREPKRELLPWSGEFAGKYLTSAVQVYRVTGDTSLRQVIAEFVSRLVSLQAEDGYLGPWPKENHFTVEAPNVRLNLPCPEGDATCKLFNKFRQTWDAWAHYHAMLGLLLWVEEAGDAAALTCARKIGDLLCDAYENKRGVDMEAVWNSNEVNQAPIHSLCLLYEHTGDSRYLSMAKRIRDEFAATDVAGTPVAGDYLNGTLAGKEFHELPKPRWESLHPIMGLAELYTITGDEKSRQAFESIWWSIVKGDRHNNGGFSSGERATGNPYDKGAIETCCTVAWIALSVEMLRLTGNSVVADELELSTLNSVTGLHSPHGRWVTYDTPMDGVRRASAHTLAFQSREGSPDLNCCSCNGPRGFGMISDWALMATDSGINLNWYGPGLMSTPLFGGELTLTQETEYPRDNRTRLKFQLNEPLFFALGLRIPHWSKDTRVRINGKTVPKVTPGQYLRLRRTWRPGDVIDIAFDFSLQYWVGEREYENKVSIYRGPILLTYDRRFNTVDPDQIPTLDARGLTGKVTTFNQWLPPMLLMEFKASDGRALRLCDFGSAGVGGSPYRSWLAVTSCTKSEFKKSNPRRSGLVA